MKLAQLSSAKQLLTPFNNKGIVATQEAGSDPSPKLLQKGQGTAAKKGFTPSRPSVTVVQSSQIMAKSKVVPPSQAASEMSNSTEKHQNHRAIQADIPPQSQSPPSIPQAHSQTQTRAKIVPSTISQASKPQLLPQLPTNSQTSRQTPAAKDNPNSPKLDGTPQTTISRPLATDVKSQITSQPQTTASLQDPTLPGVDSLVPSAPRIKIKLKVNSSSNK